jgi:alpha-beta hydrolase superfamily lysophospholipase
MDKNLNLIECEKKYFSTHDGVDLFYRYWSSTSEKPKGAIVLFHRGHEHSGRLAHIVKELNLSEFTFFAWDARGHGHSPGERGYSPSFATSVRDVQTFIDHITNSYDFEIEDISVIAQSVGAVAVSAWVHDYAPKIRCMVLASPAFKVKLYIPFARTMVKIKQSIAGRFVVNSYVKAKYLTHDPERITSFEQDPLITRAISTNILLELYDVADRIIDDAAAIIVPTQLLISGADWVVHHQPQHRFYERLGSGIKERHILKGFFHDTLGEKNRHLAIEKVRQFIITCYAEPITSQSLLNADKIGFTRTEADTLASPLPLFSIRGLYWAMLRLNMKMTSLFSNGVKLGEKTGYDSGSTLDYVYQNSPNGLTAFGRFSDKIYLNSIGWRGIRQRKRNIEELLPIAMQRLQDNGKAIAIMDIASGHGRYILDAILKSGIRPSSILLRDYSDLNVSQGTELINRKALQDIAKFIKADAFDPVSYESLEINPNIGVVSGLFELFSENRLILNALNGFASVIETGGYLIYTGQPWHPQLELIARALTSHRQGDAWVMRRRTQAEMDQLVESCGFTKIEQRIDQFGIFTVSLAIRN